MLILRNCRVFGAFPLLVLLFLLHILISPDSVRAEAGSVYLKNGGQINGEIMEVMPQQYATVKLADGTVRKITWDEIDRVDTSSKKASEPVAAPPTAQPAPAVTMPGPVAPAVPGPTIRYEERTVHGVPGMYIPGFVVFGISWVATMLLGPIISAANSDTGDDDYYSSDYSDDSSDSGPAGIDVAAAVIPVIGPWIGLASSDSRVSDTAWILSGTTQALGIVLATVGLAMPRTRMVPVYSSNETGGATTAYLTPVIMGHGGAGISLRINNF
jgi:hypothetical protein